MDILQLGEQVITFLWSIITFIISITTFFSSFFNDFPYPFNIFFGLLASYLLGFVLYKVALGIRQFIPFI